MSDSEPLDPDQPPARARDRAPEGRSVLDIVRVGDRLDLVADMIAQLKPPSVIASALVAQGLSRDHANRYQAAVRMRWQRNGRLEGREGRVQRYRAALERQAELADKEGDRKAAIAAIGLLLKHEGEAEPPLLPGETTTASESVVLLTENEAAEEMARRRREGQL